LALPPGTRFLVLAPVVRGQKGEYKDLFADMLKRGYVRARVDGQVVRLTDELRLDRRMKHDIEIVVDRLQNDPKIRPRLAEAVEQALALANGTVIISVEPVTPRPERSEGSASSAPLEDSGRGVPNGDILLSAHYACLHCNRSYQEPSPQLFSF